MALRAGRFALNNELWWFRRNSMRSSVFDHHRGIFTGSTLLSPSTSTTPANDDKGNQIKELKENEHSDIQEKGIPSQSVTNSQSDGHGVDLSMRFKYPEMFPDPFIIFRNPLKEKLERKDMLSRRSRIYIPEFYVGSVLRVTLANIHQPDKTSEFVGICIQREECGLKAFFILRNVVDNLGVEIKIELYDPRLHKIEVLKLERRLDTHLRYLRDAPPEYSTFPLDMKAEIRRTNEVPLNEIKVKLNPRPWTENWFKYDYKGVENIDELITRKMKGKADKLKKPWEKYDLMKTYRETLPEEEIGEILSEIQEDVQEHERKHKRRQ